MAISTRFRRNVIREGGERSPRLSSQQRGNIVLFSSVIAAACCVFKVLYSVEYAPPEHSRYAKLNLLHLASFHAGHVEASLRGTQLLMFSAFSGPIAAEKVLWAVALMFSVGLAAVLTPRLDIDKIRGPVAKAFKVAHHSVSAFAAIASTAALLWASRIGHQPTAIRAQFVSDLHGTAFARHASKYVTGHAELGAVALMGALVFGAGFLYSNKIMRVVAIILVFLVLWSLVEASR